MYKYFRDKTCVKMENTILFVELLQYNFRPHAGDFVEKSYKKKKKVIFLFSLSRMKTLILILTE